ncbi:MAG: GNAT family N-acetyltransferase, partial [Candidatus Binatia bacterium]
MADRVHIRRESAADIAAVAALNRAAFERTAEADLVDQLRAAGQATVALVAERDGALLGHILFSPVTIEHAGPELRPLGLAPMAVRPDAQRAGIGTALARA